MKKSITLFLALLCFAFNYAQNNTINYKAVVKDAAGNLATSESFNLNFIILEGTTPVYEESHGGSTDANGIVILDIGSGTPLLGTFNTIDWSSGTYSLTVVIDLASGTGPVDLGTTEFKSVPYALNAINSSGLQRIELGGGTLNPSGWQLDDGEYLDGGFIIGPGNWAVDMMIHKDLLDSDGSASQGTGASGLYSFGAGEDNAVIGDYAVGFGGLNAIEGTGSAVFGKDNWAFGEYSLVHGSANRTMGDYISAFGKNLKADAFHSFVLGRYNVGVGTASSWVETEPIFEIGNGTDDASRSNALTILKNGTITAPSLTNALIDTAGDKALVTKEYADAQAGAFSTSANVTSNAPGDITTDDFVFGSTQLAYDGPFGFDSRLFFDKSKGAFRAGSTESVNSFDGTAWDDANVGFGSFAIGNNTTASELFSTAMGQGTTASGRWSTALGLQTKAEAWGDTAIGLYNVGGGNTTDFPPLPASPLFEIGNGTSNFARSNALSVFYDGTITAPSLTNALIDAAGDKALVTKEYTDSFGGSGLTQIMEGGNTGWRLELDPILDGGTVQTIGEGAIDMTIHEDGPNPFNFVGASGDYSFAANKDNFAEGLYSAAFGFQSYTKGTASFATGLINLAEGSGSFAAGTGSNAFGDNSSAIGIGINVTASSATAVGSYNLDDPNAAFMVGNGTNGITRSNAMIVLKSGKTTVSESAAVFDAHAINGIKTHTGNVDAAGVYGENTVADFFGIGVEGFGGWRGVEGRVSGTGNLSYSGTVGLSTGFNTGTNYGVFGSASGGVTNYAVYASGDLAYTGAIVNASDRKLKTNINPVTSILPSIARLKPSTYSIAPQYVKSMNMSSKPQFGFVAQEIQEVFPDLVSVNKHPGATKEDAPMEYLGVNYVAMIPILTAGMQEQQKQIETQQALIEQLIARIEALENR